MARNQAEFDTYVRVSALADSTSAAKDKGHDSSDWKEMFGSTPELQYITSQLIAAERARLGLDDDAAPAEGSGTG